MGERVEVEYRQRKAKEVFHHAKVGMGCIAKLPAAVVGATQVGAMDPKTQDTYELATGLDKHFCTRWNIVYSAARAVTAGVVAVTAFHLGTEYSGWLISFSERIAGNSALLQHAIQYAPRIAAVLVPAIDSVGAAQSCVRRSLRYAERPQHLKTLWGSKYFAATALEKMDENGTHPIDMAVEQGNRIRTWKGWKKMNSYRAWTLPYGVRTQSE